MLTRTAILIALVAVASLVFVGSVAANPSLVDIAGSSIQYASDEGAAPDGARTIPYWSSSFVYGGIVYPFTMVGTDPAAGPARTIAKTALIPLNFQFDAGLGGALNGSDRVDTVLSSPVFQTASYAKLRHVFVPGYGDLGTQAGPSLTTQYTDAIFKTEWWQTGGSADGYHLLVDQPTVYPTVPIEVPKNQGFDLMGDVSHQHIGLMSIYWFFNKMHNAITSMHIPPDVLPIFLSDTTFLYYGSPDNCCVLAFHGATQSTGNGNQQVNTYIYAAYITPGVGDEPVEADVYGLSHEISEWASDPFVTNNVPSWTTGSTFYGCSHRLETGDPVVGSGWSIPMPNGFTYHVTDEALFSWFAREAPSRAFDGRYTFTQNPLFTTYASGC